MARTNQKYIRPYIDGYRFGGYINSVGNIGVMFDGTPNAAYTDGCKNILIGQGNITADPLNGFFSPASEGGGEIGYHELASPATGTRNYMIAFGIGAEPVAGNPVFAWDMEQADYQVESGDGFVTASVTFGGAGLALSEAGYSVPWGVLLHADGAETGANSANGFSYHGATSKGGVFVYHLFSSNGTVTLKMQSATSAGGSYSDVTGATSGSITAAVSPKSGCVPLAATTAINEYVRWQLALGSATTATFALAFLRRI